MVREGRRVSSAYSRSYTGWPTDQVLVATPFEKVLVYIIEDNSKYHKEYVRTKRASLSDSRPHCTRGGLVISVLDYEQRLRIQ